MADSGNSKVKLFCGHPALAIASFQLLRANLGKAAGTKQQRCVEES